MKHALLSTEQIFHGRIFDLVRARFCLPDQKEYSYDLVQHPGAVTVLPVDREGNIWFIRQFRPGAGAELLELPAGLVEKGETPEACAAREVQEEIGMAAGNLEALGAFFMVPGYSTEKIRAYLATELYNSVLPADEDEFLERVTLPAGRVYAMAMAGEIEDCKTLAALLLARPRLERFLEN